MLKKLFTFIFLSFIFFSNIIISVNARSKDVLNYKLDENLVKNESKDFLVIDFKEVDFNKAEIELNPTWFVDNKKGLNANFFQLGGFYISTKTFAVINDIVDGRNISITFQKGSFSIVYSDKSEVLEWSSLENPVLVYLNYNVQDINSNYAVMNINTKNPQSNHIAPKSFYYKQKIFAEIHSNASYEVKYSGEESFEDTKGKWMNTSVNYLAARKVVSGTSKNTFEPNKNISKAEFIVMLMNILDVEFKGAWMPKPLNDQSDVPNFASEKVLQATALGILVSDKDGNLMPNKNITREEMFTTTFNAMVRLNMINESDGGMVLREFEDSEKISEYAYLPLLTLVQNGIVNGDNNYLNPTKEITRAETAQFLYNVLKYDMDNKIKNIINK